MTEPYLGEIRLVAFNNDIRNWSSCQGQMLQVNSYPALFALLGNRFGGDGRTTFQLPDLRGRTPVHVGPSMALGTVGGQDHLVLVGQPVLEKGGDVLLVFRHKDLPPSGEADIDGLVLFWGHGFSRRSRRRG